MDPNPMKKVMYPDPAGQKSTDPTETGYSSLLIILIISSDEDLDWVYPDPQNLMNPDPVQIQVDKITKLIQKIF